MRWTHGFQRFSSAVTLTSSTIARYGDACPSTPPQEQRSHLTLSASSPFSLSWESVDCELAIHLLLAPDQLSHAADSRLRPPNNPWTTTRSRTQRPFPCCFVVQVSPPSTTSSGPNCEPSQERPASGLALILKHCSLRNLHLLHRRLSSFIPRRVN